jgi:choline dehydrogenase-like flavoprotein
MGVDHSASALDADGRFRGFTNLYVVDGSALPTAAAVNPSLTIAANALRVADRLVRAPRWVDGEIHSERKEAAYALA